jgi:SRSO17 transposase
VSDYVNGLLTAKSRRNSRRLADLAGEARVDGMQRLLTSAKWDEDAVCEDLRRFVAAHLPDDGGVLTLLEEGFVRKGQQSVGVARQYRPATARVENCQIGLFLVFAPPGAVGILLDRELYLPPSWVESQERRRRGGVPDDVVYRAKFQLAIAMIERTLAGPVPVRWVVSDLPYSADPAIRAVLEAHRIPYVLGVEGSEPLSLPAIRASTPIVPSSLVIGVPLAGPFHQTESGGSTHAWVRIPLSVRRDSPMAYWLLVRRSPNSQARARYYLCHVARGSQLSDVTSVLEPGPVEDALRLARECAGLDRYEVRTWRGWYRHITLSIAAQACLALARGARPDRGDESSIRKASETQHVRDSQICEDRLT